MLVVLGNPSYNMSSKNNNPYILDLIQDYSLIDSLSLNRKCITHLNNDYVKFIRFAEHKIENSDEGLLGIVTNNGFLDSITLRGMRYHLLKTFDEIYIINLHGNKRKEEKTDDGVNDQNIFHIQIGVCISIFVKYKAKTKKNELASVFYKSIKGKRFQKYEFLDSNDIFSVEFEQVQIESPNYFFVKKNLENEVFYSKGISLEDIFVKYGRGVDIQQEKRIAVGFTKEELLETLKDFVFLKEQTARHKYNLKMDSSSWNLSMSQQFLKYVKISDEYVQKIVYNPFDFRFVYYSKINKGILSSSGYSIMKHMLYTNNIGLVLPKLLSADNFKHAFVVSDIVKTNMVSGRVRENAYLFPLFLVDEQRSLEDYLNPIKENFKENFRNFVNYKYYEHFEAQDILGYIYAVLSSNIYRTKFNEFLKVGFPKIIFVDEIEIFKKLSRLGISLIDVQLLRDTSKLDWSIGIHISQTDEKRIIQKIEYFNETKELVYSNNGKFTNVPYEVYAFDIGIYRVLKSFLDCRKGRELSIDEIAHLEKVIKVVHYTIEVQEQIDMIICNLKEFGCDTGLSNLTLAS